MEWNRQRFLELLLLGSTYTSPGDLQRQKGEAGSSFSLFFVLHCRILQYLGLGNKQGK